MGLIVFDILCVVYHSLCAGIDYMEDETGQFSPTAKLALVICIALDKKFEELFYF